MTIYFVRASGGSDGNTGLSFAQGWATLSYAFLNSTTDDTINVCSDADNKFSLSSTWVVSDSRKIIGCDLVDGSAYNGTGRAYIIAGATLTSLVQYSDDEKVLLQDIDIDGNDTVTNSLYFSDSAELENILVHGCYIHSATYGVKIEGVSTAAATDYFEIVFHTCKIYDCTDGILIVGTNYDVANAKLYNCAIYNNSQAAVATFDTYSGITLINSRLYNNSYGINIGAS